MATVDNINNNHLWVTGYNGPGQLGLGSNTDQNKFVQVPNWNNKHVKFINCGWNYTVIVTESDVVTGNGLLVTGKNNYGQLGINNKEDQKSFIEVSEWNNKQIDLISCGESHTVVVTEDNMKRNDVWVTGWNERGQLGLNNYKNQKKFTKVPKWNNKPIKLISCGKNHTTIVTKDNSLWVAGHNYFGQLGLNNRENQKEFIQVPDWNNKPIKLVSCGVNYTIIVTEDNHLWVTGCNEDGQLGLNNRESQYKFIQVPDWNDNLSIKLISCTLAHHTAVVTEDESIGDQLWMTGYNDTGQLGLNGNNTYTRKFIPVPIWNNNSAKLISCSWNHTVVATEDDHLWVTGYNGNGQLGLGNNKDQKKFVQTAIEIFDQPVVQQVAQQVRITNFTQSQPAAQRIAQQIRTENFAQSQVLSAEERIKKLQEETKKRAEKLTDKSKESKESKEDIDAIKNLFKTMGDNEVDLITGHKWYELDEKDRSNIISISIDGKHRECWKREDIIQYVQDQKFAVWCETRISLNAWNQHLLMCGRMPLAGWNNEGHGGEVDPKSPIYAKFLPTRQFYFEKESTMKLIQDTTFCRYNVVDTKRKLRLGNVLSNTGLIVVGGVHGQAPGQDIAILEGVQGEF